MQVTQVTQGPVERMGAPRSCKTGRVSHEWAIPQITFDRSVGLLTALELAAEFVLCT